MSIHIDSTEVLHHLKKYGIESIDNEAFKYFMKDLKKLIKYEQRKVCHNDMYNYETYSVPTVLQVHDSNTSNWPRSPKKFERYESACVNKHSKYPKTEKARSSNETNEEKYCCCKHSSTGSYCKIISPQPKAECEHCTSKKDINSDSSSKFETNKFVITDCSKLSDKKQFHDNTSELNKQCKKCSSTTLEKTKIDEQCIKRPSSLVSCARSQIDSKNKKLHCDPVGLYQYYQSIWKHHKLPGENDHAQLRRAIRNRLMNVK